MRSSVVQLAHARLLIVGGGAGGLGAASKFARKLPQNSVAIIEPSERHYYQPGFTFVGAGELRLADNQRNEEDLIPSKVKWYKNAAKRLVPENNSVILDNGDTLTYDYLVIACGIQPRFDLIKGAPEALQLEGSGVCSIYLPHLAEKTHREIQAFKSGNAIFTFPAGPIKCAGAPQKIMYLADEIFRKRGVRDAAKIDYYTSLPKIFGVEKYAQALDKVVKAKDITLHARTVLKEIRLNTKSAIFDVYNAEGKPSGETIESKFTLLHVAPVCRPIATVSECSSLVDAAGFVDVDPETLQSRKFTNVFAIGDTANTPNAKTAAAVSGQLGTLEVNLKAAMNGKPLGSKYDGYASCPLLVGGNKVILAEFTPKGPLETLPVNQAVPRSVSYLLKRYIMQPLYWHGLVKGYWNGPTTIRKILHFGRSN
ncbi:unnamed protein product, partial [Mesorhabditis belari]|uniref:Sulfide:quinone oxidoreductase, mitochondrial n=1 Tax=Mesorhabditis belari TaxID=2138241 RepID=A0AAF3F4R0_9BILA